MAAAAAPPNSTDIQPVTYFRARLIYTGCPRKGAREEGAPVRADDRADSRRVGERKESAEEEIRTACLRIRGLCSFVLECDRDLDDV